MVSVIRGMWEDRGWKMLAVLGVLALGFVLQACSGITSSGRPGKARFLLEGPESAAMTVMMSQAFFVREDGGLDFQSLDTKSVTVPIDETVDLGEPARFYISASNAGEAPQVFTMKVWIGGKIWYNETKILDPGEDFEFVYRYNEPGLY